MREFITAGRNVSLFALSTILFLQTIPSNAQSLEEIVVTAQYREQGLQDVPLSISAVTGDTMTDNSIVKIEDLATLVPNLNYSETGITTTILIRGIGSGVNQGFEQSVGLYVDGVHHPRGQQMRAPFLDLERVEALRGPQSILFGKNSVAGALNITTAKPTEEVEGSIFVSNEFEDGETIIEGVLSGALTDRVQGRIAIRKRDSDGYQENLTLNQDGPAADDLTVRAQLAFDVSDTLSANIKYEKSDFDVIGRNIEIENAFPAQAGPFTGLNYGQILAGVFGQDPGVLNITADGKRSSNGDTSFNEMETTQLTLDWQLGDFELNSITAYENMDYTDSCDCDFTGADIFIYSYNETYEQFSQELRLTSPVGEKFDYILGAYYQSSDHHFDDGITVSPTSVLIPAINGAAPGLGSAISGTQASRLAEVDAETLSAFAQANWRFTDDWTLQLGGRITRDDKQGFRTLGAFSNGGGPLTAAQALAPVTYAAVFDISTTNLAALGPTGQFFYSQLGLPEVNGDRVTTKFSPDAKLVWDLNDDTLLYASWAKGFKSGGFDFRANNRGTYASSDESFEFEDEEANNFEIGGKFKIGDSAELNATLFFTEFNNLQISIFDGTLGFNVGNAAGAEVKGIEFDGRWALSDTLTLSGGLALTDFEFTDFRNGQCYAGQTPTGDNGQCDYRGLKNNLVSDVSGNLTLDYTSLFAGGNYELNGMLNVFYASDYLSAQTQDPLSQQDSFTRVNARIGAGPADGKWEIALLAKNLTDEIVRTYNGDAPLAFSSFGAKTNYTFYSQGRTMYVQGRYNF